MPYLFLPSLKIWNPIEPFFHSENNSAAMYVAILYPRTGKCLTAVATFFRDFSWLLQVVQKTEFVRYFHSHVDTMQRKKLTKQKY